MSKKWDEDRWGPHAHCAVCGNAMQEGEGKRVCSPECQKKYDEEIARAKRSQRYGYVIIALMGIAVLGFFIITQFFPG